MEKANTRMDEHLGRKVKGAEEEKEEAETREGKCVIRRISTQGS